jgi:hypothetical protein
VLKKSLILPEPYINSYALHFNDSHLMTVFQADEETLATLSDDVGGL